MLTLIKECSKDTFSLDNIHEHQISFMQSFKEQKGIAFILIYFSKRDIFYFLPIDDLMFFWKRAKDGGRKSFKFDELNRDYIFEEGNGAIVPYLDMVAKYLEKEG